MTVLLDCVAGHPSRFLLCERELADNVARLDAMRAAAAIASAARAFTGRVVPPLRRNLRKLRLHLRTKRRG